MLNLRNLWEPLAIFSRPDSSSHGTPHLVRKITRKSGEMKKSMIFLGSRNDIEIEYR